MRIETVAALLLCALIIGGMALFARAYTKANDCWLKYGLTYIPEGNTLDGHMPKGGWCYPNNNRNKPTT